MLLKALPPWWVRGCLRALKLKPMAEREYSKWDINKRINYKGRLQSIFNKSSKRGALKLVFHTTVGWFTYKAIVGDYSYNR